MFAPNPAIQSKLAYFLTTKKIPNIIFHGEPKSGKRTLLNDFLHQIYEGSHQKMKTHIMTVECSHGKGIKFIREDLKFFAKAHIQSNHGANFKSIVLLNADSLTIDAQSALRRCIELFSHNTRFFILVENKERLLNPILSRFCEIYVAPVGAWPGEATPPEAWAVFKQTWNSFGGMCDRDATALSGAFIAKSAAWCEEGWCVQDWIECLQCPACATDADIAPSPGYTHRHLIAMCYHKIKPDFRCEKMLMFYVLYLTFVSSKSDLENMLL